MGDANQVRSVDVAVIGAGTAGLAAYRAAAAIAPRVVVVEGGMHGTTCARVGCMPSKLLIAAAEVAHEARHSAPFGLAMTVSVDGGAVMDRVRRERDRFVGFVLQGVDRIPESDKLVGLARFTAGGPEVELAVGETLVRARAVVVATGSSPVVPKLLSELGDRVVVNDDVFAWERLPESVAVFGAGVIGLEIGQALHRLGVRVRIFGRGGRVGPLTDPVVRASALAALATELPLMIDADVRAVRRVGDQVIVEWRDTEGQACVETFAYALAATGRRSNFAGLDLERVGIRVDARGPLGVDPATTRVGDTNVFFAGDINAARPLLHEAADEGKIAGESAARYPDVRPWPRRSPLTIVFTDPQIAVVGEPYGQLEMSGPDVVYGHVSFEDQGRSRVMLKNHGAARIYADARTGRFLGAEMAGPRAENIGHLLAWSHQQGLTVDQMLAMPFYHPVVEEGIRTALRDASAKLAAARH
jgi:dihydrolipoamide dehydrogenase